MSGRVLPGHEGLKTPCGEHPHWISKRAELPPRMLCVKAKGHKGKHQNGQDHSWKK